MDKIRIYPILEYILNEADTDDLAAIREALKRREKQQAFGGVNIQNVARQTGRSIEEQVGASVESIRDMIRNYAVQIIKGQAPEIGDEQLETLLESWIPDPGKKSRGGQSAGDIPQEALLTMIRQYIAYKTESMDPRELKSLVAEIGDWPQAYWSKFPVPVRRIITKYLNKEIDADMCWELINRSI
ncbi:hypothetical protein B4O97_16885 [Marispirochaeta aestuarii]|uniref:Uncharacterized protein n=1 Tax=Marispirochaeta aestuarii TaxID=1963862 RepID=A0A1Y1RU23_9SPIO|nr:hypothetical protein [Marispirochaeta aestuarii]ORC31822.1 hypothetical protein B4O97_16885 [Marispirochaeta aestuarii]